ncbi:hypothetical protein ABVC96_21595 [Xanthomonas euvesicatoria]|nr:hypothetical protein [Xanthomonas phage MYK3]
MKSGSTAAVNELSRRQAAQYAFTASLEKHRATLARALQADRFVVTDSASVRVLVRLARTQAPDSPALRVFEAAIRPPLVAYVNATPKEAHGSLLTDAQFLRDHFDRFTKVPLTPNPIKRVVSWTRRKLGGTA